MLEMNTQTLIQWLIVLALVVAGALLASGLLVLRRHTRERGGRLGDVIVCNIRGTERLLLLGSVTTLFTLIPALIIVYAILLR